MFFFHGCFTIQLDDFKSFTLVGNHHVDPFVKRLFRVPGIRYAENSYPRTEALGFFSWRKDLRTYSANGQPLNF